MTDDPKLAMARRIAARIVYGGSDWEHQGRHMIAGLEDEREAVEVAIATIEECTERAAKLAIGWRDENKSSIDDGDQSIAAQKVRGAAIEMNAFARALRSGDHLKGPTA